MTIQQRSANAHFQHIQAAPDWSATAPVPRRRGQRALDRLILASEHQAVLHGQTGHCRRCDGVASSVGYLMPHGAALQVGGTVVHGSHDPVFVRGIWMC